MGAFTIYAIKSAICLVLLYLPYTLLMRRDTFHAFNRTLLLGIVMLSLVLPLMKPLSFLPQGEMIPNPIESLEEEIEMTLTLPLQGGEGGGSLFSSPSGEVGRGVSRKGVTLSSPMYGATVTASTSSVSKNVRA